MRLPIVLPLALSLAATACNAQPADNAASGNAAKLAAAQTSAEPLALKASDGVVVHGLLYKGAAPKTLILLFHQAGSSKDEYATIAPRLVAAGYSALAIDQRAGGGLFGTNETAAGTGRKADYLEALPDLQAALDWAQTQKLPIVVWGSSYSSALIFPLAASDPQGIVALLIMAALPKNAGNVRFVPQHGVHGSSTLIATRNPQDAEENMRAVLAFLGRVAPQPSH